MRKYLLLYFIAALASGSVLIENGDFEQDLSVGWEQMLCGPAASISRATTYDPDPDYEAYVYKGTGDGYVILHQLTHIPTTDLEFSARIKLLASSNSTTCWACAAFVIAYMDDAGHALGETMICRMSPASPWTNTPTRHLIVVADTNWHDYAFNINAELANLPGINPADVARIEVRLYGFVESG